MIEKEEKKALVVNSLKKLKVEPSKPRKEIEEFGEKAKKSLIDNGIYTSNGEVFIAKVSIPSLLATDSKGANIVYTNQENKDKFVDGKNKYISLPAMQKEISTRIQQPRDTIQKERLKYSEELIKNVRDAEELEKIRELEESRIRKELSSKKKAKLKKEEVDDITKEKLINPDVHHKIRVADDPTKALDEDNLVALNRDTHKDVHRNNADTPESYEKYKQTRQQGQNE